MKRLKRMLAALGLFFLICLAGNLSAQEISADSSDESAGDSASLAEGTAAGTSEGQDSDKPAFKKMSGFASLSALRPPSPEDELKYARIMQALGFLTKPQGMSFRLGFGPTAIHTLFDPEFYSSPYSPLWAASLGMELNPYFLSVRVSPYWGAQAAAFYLDAETGFYLGQDKKEGSVFSTKIYSYGSLYSVNYVTDPKILRHTLWEATTGGLGYVETGIGIEGLAGYRSGAFSIDGGIFVQLGTMLPFYPMFDLGLIGPKIELALVPDSLYLYADIRPWKLIASFTHMEAGLRYVFK